MSCSVAVSNSPVFSPSSSLFCNKPSETLTLTLTQLKASASNSPSSSSSSPSSSPRSPFRLRLQKPPAASSSLGSSSSSSAVLKRKRPARLDIPVIEMGFGVGGPITPAAEMAAEIEREGCGYSVYCKRGRREAMEDRFSAVLDLQAHPKQAFFGVFDGHGGSKAAEYAAQNLDKNIVDEIVRRDEEHIEDAVKHGYLNTDAQFLKQDLRGGSCCVTALIRNGNLVVSNAGDCRAVMSIQGISEALTSDHRPSREDEKNRIETLGGYVDLIRGAWRIQGSLAVSRGIGDRHLKQWVIAEPETKVLRIKPEHEFLILASDGLWDMVGNQEAVDIVRPLCIGVDKPDPLSACKKLVDLSVSRGSTDDISVMMIQMQHYV
ncbi:probable protein phosphatase 2C 25 isoform X2 [Ricinus communis]|uniref:protein-serine/threonine phosphatase n=1 Tax=Ricinus communis TaxID=3988 RepID=B9S5C5_RICCO|nr:probable protein phosphatase 2C 25 isoform X2 [Ricinus communis]EEF41194.1 protein phosphatase 2c, putative [Ricinus communis]|eukprot:XP_002521194.1 probable protein phosphatase 2C 25 isoform X2 [Ricinus communis]